MWPPNLTVSALRDVCHVSSFPTATVAVARQLDGLAGGLTPPASAADSVLAAVGDRNGEHFFVGTQDEALRDKLRKVGATRCRRVVCRAAFSRGRRHHRFRACRNSMSTPPALRWRFPQKRSAKRRCVAWGSRGWPRHTSSLAGGHALMRAGAAQRSAGA